MPTIDLDRGERNRNPGNIDRNPRNHWIGLSRDQSSDPRFCVFTDMVFGVRALAKLLTSYQRKYDCQTIRELIERWAPGNENDTEAYIAAVATDTSHDPDDPIDLSIPALLASTTRAIIHHENGRVLPSIEAVIPSAVAMALAATTV